MTFDFIEKKLQANPFQLLPRDARKRTAVALILREQEYGPEILFVRRALHPGDPWSGDIGFPGGKVEPWDAGPRAAAERETREEVGIDLSRARFLGPLCEIAGAHLPVRICCFVYGIAEPVAITLQHEISAFFWFSLQDLSDRDRHLEGEVVFRGERMLRPAIRLLEPGETLLWGITYRLVMKFLETVNMGP